MKLILQEANTFVIKINHGEEVFEELSRWAKGENVKAATFACIGAADEAELWWYDVTKKKYVKQTFQEQLEITGVLGNIARKDGEIMIHMHGTFSDREYRVYGGHINKIVVSGACEARVDVLKGEIKKAYDEETGLNVMQQA